MLSCNGDASSCAATPPKLPATGGHLGCRSASGCVPQSGLHPVLLSSRASDLTSARSRSLAGATHSPGSARPVQTRGARQTLRLKSTQETVCPHSLAVLVRHADTRVFSIDPGAHSRLLSLLFSPVPQSAPVLSCPPHHPSLSLQRTLTQPLSRATHPPIQPVQPQCNRSAAARGQQTQAVKFIRYGCNCGCNCTSSSSTPSS